MFAFQIILFPAVRHIIDFRLLSIDDTTDRAISISCNVSGKMNIRDCLAYGLDNHSFVFCRTSQVINAQLLSIIQKSGDEVWCHEKLTPVT